MTDKATHLGLNPNQTVPSGFGGTPTAAAADPSPPAHPLYPPHGPAPEGTTPATAEQMAQQGAHTHKGDPGTGVVGEQVVWEARYSMRNFLGRLTLCALASLGWLGLLAWAWNHGRFHGAGAFAIDGLGAVLGVAWIALLVRMFYARACHFYQLTNRRLFLSTGLFRHRRDQMELIGIKDVYERQTLVERWLAVGTVVVLSPKAELPTFYLTGVNDPRRVMDLIWHYARAEREGKTVQVENL